MLFLINNTIILSKVVVCLIIPLCPLFIFVIQQKRADEARLHKTASGASSKNGAEPKTGHSDGRMSRYKTEYYSMAAKNPAASTDTEKPSRDEQWVQDHAAILRWTPRRVDRIARYVYPIAFLIFNMLYWPIFLFIDNNA